MRATRVVLLLCIGILGAATACSHRTVRAIKPANVPPDDNSYLDLKPGGTLRVLVPLMNSAGAAPLALKESTDGKTVSVSATNFVGYETSYYAVTGKRDGAVKLKFESAEISRSGKTFPASTPPALPFKIPQRRQHIRLIYLVRISRADHNMAILASKHVDALNAFTKRLKQSPAGCGEDQAVFCSWVPAGIAVRPE